VAKEITHSLIESNDDEILWLQMRQGNHLAYQKLYLAYVDDLYRYGRMVIREKCLVEDTIHDIFTDIWSSRNSLGEVISVRLYLFSSFKRRLLRKIKKEHRTYFLPTIDLNTFEIVPSLLDEHIEHTEQKILAQKMQKYVGHLSPRQREIIYLRFYQGLTYAEIAKLLNLDQKYTYNLASKAFQALRGIISKSITTFGFLLTCSIAENVVV
jgi:RNA polymerase sigma factor (sigma-70 family)